MLENLGARIALSERRETKTDKNGETTCCVRTCMRTFAVRYFMGRIMFLKALRVTLMKLTLELPTRKYDICSKRIKVQATRETQQCNKERVLPSILLKILLKITFECRKVHCHEHTIKFLQVIIKVRRFDRFGGSSVKEQVESRIETLR